MGMSVTLAQSEGLPVLSVAGELDKLHIVLAREGGDLAVVCRGAHVTRMVKELGIGHILPIFVDQATAVASLLPLIAESH